MNKWIVDEPRSLTLGRRILILFAALSYVFFFTDVYMGHYLWAQLFLKRLVLSFALIPIFFSPIGLVAALWAAFRLTPRAMAVFRGAMLTSMLIGLAGTYFHLAPRVTMAADLLAARTWLGDPPLLAPAAFALPGIIGLLASYGLAWREVESRGEPMAREATGDSSPGAESLAKGGATPLRG